MTSARNAMFWEWSAQQYAVPIGLAAEVCEVALNRMYELAHGWKRAGFVHTGRFPSMGPGGVWSNTLWLWTTRETTWSFTGFDPGPWSPRLSTVNHLRALGELRLALTGRELDPQVWTSERLLRRRGAYLWEAGATRDHVHDGEFRDGAGDRWAVEVELTRKRGGGRLAETVRAALEAARTRNLSGVVYFTRGTDVRQGLDTAVAELADAGHGELLHTLDIRDLDQFLSGSNDSKEVS
ncbi:hypothetical protein ACIRRA_13500 [Nocardia sp. NPDC101769]|uniref:hypothetical protein n=1 Tax=Nocardia sp. NPDC101769 TaxID=3364333 RepID=UPI003829F479